MYLKHIKDLECREISFWNCVIPKGFDFSKFEYVKYSNKGDIAQNISVNKGISENTNAAIDMASGEYIGFLDHDDLLSQDALYEVVKAINEEKNVDFISKFLQNQF